MITVNMPPRRGDGIGQGRPEAMQFYSRRSEVCVRGWKQLRLLREQPLMKGMTVLKKNILRKKKRRKMKLPEFIKMLVKVGGKPKVEIPTYERSLNAEELMNWIRSLDKYFDSEEEVDNKKKVKFAVTRLKGHAAIWWDELQTSRMRKGKSKIKQCDNMVSKMKAKFTPKDYELNLLNSCRI